jgi:hypothetical protein
MKTLIWLVVIAVAIFSGIVVTALPHNSSDDKLTKQVADVIAECQKIKPGMTRADLLKLFTTEGGFSTAAHRQFVFPGCPYIKVEVDFTLSDKRQPDERSTDIILKISKPYLELSIID